MAGVSPPKSAPATAFPSQAGTAHRDGDWLWVPLKAEWRNVAAKPEEIVRQGFIRHLVDDYGYVLEQMDQERRTMHGHKSPRADIVVWETPAHKAKGASPVLVIECKAESIDVNLRDYYQGESYTRAAGCEFFVAHNARYTAIFKLVPGAPGDFVQINELPAAADWGDAKRLNKIKNELRAFNRKEFQDLLYTCHSILRSVHKMEPGRAFDTISKILFIKMFVERSGLHGTFTVDFLDRRASTRMKTDPEVHDGLFDQTKTFYKADNLFNEADKLEISESTFRRIVKELERFDLSKTSDDIKGLAFERFLGATFRGELGQYFTPRPVVDFMVSLLDPSEGDLICDPAAGSGGFLIKAFEHVRDKIIEDVQTEKDAARAAIEAKGLEQDEEDRLISDAFLALNQQLLPSSDDNTPVDTRVGRLAWKCIFGTDAEPRAARTAKMNMIMHGDGHGGIHNHDGLVDINGVFPGRFDVVITNPPFGSSVGADQRLDASAETRVPRDPAYQAACAEKYGEAWQNHYERLRKAADAKTKLLDLFEIGKGKNSRDTEIIFVERCLELLKPGGRLGIVLPDGNLNNPSTGWLRRWCEGRARILAIVSLPEETFKSAAATVKASIVFLQRFTETEAAAWEDAWTSAHAALDATYNAERDAACAVQAERLANGGLADAKAVLAALAALGVARTPPTWSQGAPPAYPKGVGPTQLGASAWAGEATDETRAKTLRQDYAALGKKISDAAKATSAELRAALREIDRKHNAALWDFVRSTADYPVFVAAPQAVGITSTGETGEGVRNDLDAVLSAYKQFSDWVTEGALAEAAPDFLLPSAA